MEVNLFLKNRWIDPWNHDDDSKLMKSGGARLRIQNSYSDAIKKQKIYI